MIESSAPARMRLAASARQQAERHAQRARMNENSPICARLAAIVSAVRTRIAERAARSPNAASDLPTMTIRARRPAPAAARGRRIVGSKSMPTDDEEQHGERVLQRQRVRRGLVAEVGFADHHAGEERAERERHAEQHGGADGDAEGDREHARA